VFEGVKEVKVLVVKDKDFCGPTKTNINSSKSEEMVQIYITAEETMV
jgi:hypothetical protein